MATYNSADINKENRPKLNPVKAIRKFILSQGIKLDDEPPIFYAWETKRQPRWFQSENGLYPEKPFITVDYDKQKREWYIGYIISANTRYFGTIDDLTGRCDLASSV